MATRDKHRTRSHVTYRENCANGNHWLATRPYILPVGFRHLFNMVDDVKKEAEETKDEVSNS